MSWWNKDQPASVRADAVRDLIKLGMRETDAADRDIHSKEFDAAKNAYDLRTRTATKAELTAAHEALRRHGY
ncbi:hypothetical protein [Actinoplanes sp. NPDC051494]|uniref:hypothetical protein n=1 Tax=Actinoplanes sp. NPDC051494 TaxID=3363907 RepID=UPI00378EC9AE